MPNPAMQAVFKRALEVAKDLRKKDPSLKQSDAVKKAWQTPEILKMKEKAKAQGKKK